MPELPEVESARSHLHRICAGHRIVRVELKEQGGGPRSGLVDDIIFEIPTVDNKPTEVSGKSKKKKTNENMDEREEIFYNALMHKNVEAVHRRGKQLWFTFDEPESVPVLFHFGMTGSFLIKDEVIPSYKSFKILPGEKVLWPPRFTKCEIEFDNGACVAYCDPRRIGRIKLRRNPLITEPINELGIDPLLGPLPTPEELERCLRGISAPIKAILLDQNRVFCGIGNYLADEILYQAGIYPETKACRINRLGITRLLEKLQYIINTAVACDARYEDFPREWLFHYRWDKVKSKSERLRMPDGSIIVFETCGGRTSAIVPSKQPRSGDYTRQEPEENEEDAAVNGKDEGNQSDSRSTSVGRKRKLDTIEKTATEESHVHSEQKSKKRKSSIISAAVKEEKMVSVEAQLRGKLLPEVGK